MEVAWTAYVRYRATLRGFDLDRIEEIVTALYGKVRRYGNGPSDRRRSLRKDAGVGPV